MVTSSYGALPAALRDFLGPRIKVGRKTTADGTPTYVNVSPQSGHGNGYQVQWWTGKGHVRLGTVADPMVGGLLVAATALDASLLKAPLGARDWLVDLLAHPEKVDAWIRSVCAS